MASQIYIPGPTWTFAGVGTSGIGGTQGLLFYGFTERGLTLSRSGKFEDVNVDYSGMMPADVSMLGQEARVSGDFTQYSETVAELCAAFLFNGGTLAQGTGGNFSIGTLLNLESGSFPLLIYCPYGGPSGKSEYKANLSDMAFVYYFPAVYLTDQYEVTLSVRRKAPRAAWKAIPTWGTYTSGVFQPGAAPFDAYVLYDTEMPSGVTYADLITLISGGLGP